MIVAEPLATVSFDRATRVGFISDLHLAPSRPDIEQRLETFLARAADELDVLVILGDLFEFWIGDDAAALCGYREVVEKLAAFFASGACRGYFMHGNRDFLVGEAFCATTRCQLLDDPCLMLHGGSPVLLAHGDAYCTDDTDHQRFRAMVRDPDWQRTFLASDARERLARALDARAVSESVKTDKPAQIMDVNGAAIESAMTGAAVGLMIHGHTHRPAVHRHRVGGGEGHRVVLGDWFEQPNSLTVVDGELHYRIGDTRHRLALPPARPTAAR